jgi:hypothetical protein
MKRTLALLLVLIVGMALAACSSKKETPAGFVFVDESGTETAVASTAWAESNPTPTPEPPVTAAPTSTPYAMPTHGPAYDGSKVITRVGNEDITLDDYQKHVRFDRYRYLYGLTRLVEKYGVAKILDLTNPDNQYVASLVNTLADSYSFGAQSQRLMVIERIVTQEALRRGIEVDPTLFDAKLAEYLSLIPGDGGKLPPEFDQRYPEFIQGLQTYAGMSEEEFRKIVRARALYDQLEMIISHEPGVIPQDQKQVGVQVQDAVVPVEKDAQAIAVRLQAGETLRNILTSLGYQPGDTGTSDDSHVVRRGDSALTDEIITALFSAQPGEVVGPFPLQDGWYVGKVSQQMIDFLSPEQIDKLRQQHYLDWVEGQMDDPAVVTDYQNWIDDTPQDPLPQDVSPLLRDENFIRPANEVQQALEGTATPTP